MSEAKQGVTSPPAGNGNVPGLGEAFSINLSTGQGVYAYKMPLPDGVAGHAPKLTLEYAHSQGHSPCGYSWRVQVRSIARRLDFGVPDQGTVERYTDSGAEIVPVADGGYRALAETAFSRYSRAGQGWKIEDRGGAVHELGLSANARVADPDHAERIYEWLLERSLDVSGNAITYRYLIDSGMTYVSEISYAIYTVRFEYESRPDSRRDGKMGFLRQRALQCKRVALVLHPGQPDERVIRSWSLAYHIDPTSGLSLLASITLTSHGAASDGSLDVRRPATTFGYTRFESNAPVLHWMEAPKDGPPPPLTEKDVALVTMDHAPLPGILQIRNGEQHYWPNRGDGTWGYPVRLRRTPNIASFADAGLVFLDMDASGRADLLVASDERLPGYYENSGRDGWARFVAFPRGQRTAPAWTSPNLKVTDCDGDGRIDALMSTSRGFAVWRNRAEQGWADPVLVENVDAPSLADPTVSLADMTGDGLQDIVRVLSGRVEYWPSLGHGRFAAPVVMTNSPRLRDALRNHHDVLLIDVNGDGCADLVHFATDAIEVFTNQNGQGFGEPIVIRDTPRPIPNTVRAANMRGRMSGGLIWNSERGRGSAYIQFELGDQPPYLLTHVENGAGLISDIFYRSAVEDFTRDQAAGELWDTHFPFPYLVVAGTVERDAINGRRTEMRFRYHQAHYEPHTRQFQGFRRGERTEIADPGGSRADTVIAHHFLMGQERLQGHGLEHAALNGMLTRVETFSLDGSPDQAKPYRVEMSDFGIQPLETLPDGRVRSLVYVAAHRVEDSERGGDVRGEEKTYTYDGFGNVVTEQQRGYGMRNGVVQPERKRVSTISYAGAITRWMLDRVTRVVVRDEAGRLISETRRYYDGPDFVGLPLGQADRGLVTREEECVLPEANFNAHYAGMNATALGYARGQDADEANAFFAPVRRCAYDARGLKTTALDELGNASVFTYDASGLFRVKLTDSSGDTRMEYDQAIGQITRITYADGTMTQFGYDAQGRVLATALPGEALGGTRNYRYDDASLPQARFAEFRFAPEPNGVARAVTYFDGGGKEVQQRVEHRPGQFVVSGWSTLNTWGDTDHEYQPTFSNSIAFGVPDTAGKPHRDTFYDGRGRVVKTVNYNGGVSSVVYLPFEVITYDANDSDASADNVARGQFSTPRREESDVFRYRTRVTDVLGNGAEMTTAYTVGPSGEVLSVADGHGVMVSYRYDRRASRLEVAQRDAGTRRLFYDARKYIVRTVDANGNDMHATIDDRGRLVELKANGVTIERYRYDDLARHALGKLAEVSYAGGGQAFTYNEAGSLLAHEYRFDGLAAPYVVGHEYDWLGREVAAIHPDGTRIAKTLALNGWTQAIPGFVDDVQYDPRGLPVRVAFANAVVTEIDYTAGPGRIQRQTTRNKLNQVLEETTFDFDKMEMMLGANDAAPGGMGAQGFGYDPLYQLKAVSTIENGALVTRRYEYADHYNMTRFDEGGSVLHYDDATHPDRIAGLTPNGAARVNLTYDGNGNLLSLPGKTLVYNTKNELTRFEAANGLTATYSYDYTGMRTSKTVDDGHGHVARTLFVGNEVEIRGTQPAFFVRLGGLRVAIAFGGMTRWVHNDSVGNSAFFTDGAGTKLAGIMYHPFGNVFKSVGQVDFNTYGAHPYDAESGLFYMRRRYYAPEIGRFTTPDPLAIYQPEQFLNNPKALHPFIYVANDPLNKTDPTGLSFWSVVGGVVGVLVSVVAVAAIAALVVATAGAFGVFLAVMVGIGLAFGGMAGLYALSSHFSDINMNHGSGEFMRGFLIGLNAGLNYGLASAMFGPWVGQALGVINFLAVFKGVSQNSFYQGVLAWSSWLMPMTWLANALGLAFFLINVVMHFVSYVPGWFGAGREWAKIDGMKIDWATGSIVTSGGLIKPVGVADGFNMGHFVFLESQTKKYDPLQDNGLIDHETGHGLSLAAFGSLFHLVGWLDEISKGNSAFAEELAESHAHRSGRKTVPMWG